jgi:hypothetical protein
MARTSSHDISVTYYAPGSPTSGGTVTLHTHPGSHSVTFSSSGFGSVARYKWRCQSGCSARKSFSTREEVIRAAKTHLINHQKGHMHYGMNLRF